MKNTEFHCSGVVGVLASRALLAAGWVHAWTAASPRVEDAMHATKAAVEEGIVAGPPCAEGDSGDYSRPLWSLHAPVILRGDGAPWLRL